MPTATVSCSCTISSELQSARALPRTIARSRWSSHRCRRWQRKRVLVHCRVSNVYRVRMPTIILTRMPAAAFQMRFWAVSSTGSTSWRLLLALVTITTIVSCLFPGPTSNAGWSTEPISATTCAISVSLLRRASRTTARIIQQAWTTSGCPGRHRSRSPITV